MSRSSTTLTARIAFMDRLSDDLAQRDWVTPEEGQQLVRAQGLVAPAEAIERACQSIRVPKAPPPIHGLDWGRPQDQAELAERRAMTASAYLPLARRRSRCATLTSLSFMLGMSGLLLLGFADRLWILASMSLAGLGLIATIGFGSHLDVYKKNLEDHQRLLQKLFPVTPTRHQVRLWSAIPRLRTYLAACCASDVGLLQGDVEVLEAALARGFKEDQERLSMKAVQAMALIDAEEAWSERQKKVSSP